MNEQEGTPLTIIEQLEAHRGCITLAGLAEMLAVSYKTTYRWVRTSGLPATKIAGTYWIDPQLAARWWHNHSTTVPKPPQGIRPRPTRVADVA